MGETPEKVADSGGRGEEPGEPTRADHLAREYRIACLGATGSGLAGLAFVGILMSLADPGGVVDRLAFFFSPVAAIPIVLLGRLARAHAAAPAIRAGDPPAPGLWKPLLVVLLALPLAALPAVLLMSGQTSVDCLCGNTGHHAAP